MPTPRKSLRDLVRDRTFLARRHAERLLAGELVDDEALAEIQQAYRSETDGLERLKLARRFERTVRENDGVSDRRRVGQSLYLARLFGLDVPLPPDDDRSPEAAEYRRRAELLARAARAEPQPEAFARFLSDWNEPRSRGPYVHSVARSAIREAPAELFADLERELAS